MRGHRPESVNPEAGAATGAARNSGCCIASNTWDAAVDAAGTIDPGTGFEAVEIGVIVDGLGRGSQSINSPRVTITEKGRRNFSDATSQML
jgi:hypothetical protein